MNLLKSSRAFTSLAALLLVSSVTSCGTLVSSTHEGDVDDPSGQVYGGVKLNVKEMKDEEVLPILKVINVIDLPLSAILDTLFFPYTYWVKGD